jgi:phosphatidate cytidylyltransferase
MSYLDEPERDDPGDRPGRSARAARPAWDAATYGRPDDTGRARAEPPSRRAESPPEPRRTADAYGTSDLYRAAEPWSGETAFASDSFAAESSLRSETPFAEPSYSEPPSYTETSYTETSYPETSYTETSYPETSYPETSYPEPSYPETSYPEPSYPEPSYPELSYPETSYASGAYRSELSIGLDEPYRAGPAAADPFGDRPNDRPDPAEPPGRSAGDPYATGDPFTGRHPADAYPTDQYPTDQDNGAPPRGLPPADYPGGLPADADADAGAAGQPAHRTSRAGRNLPAAVGVGLGLGAIVLASLFLWRPAFLAVIAVAVGVAIWELVRAIRTSGANPPLVPLLAGGALMTCLAWWGQADALTFGLVVTVLAVMVWRFADGVGDYGRDVTAAALVAVYVPFLAGFAALLATPADGDLRVLVTLAGVVLSDTGGYIAGVFFGRHPMAPSVSPKKSWEGLAGSLLATSIGGALMLFLLFDVSLWWGAVFGLAVSAASVLGDLGESMLKRDLGVKDMSGLLPGHGGLMDRLDSIVFALPTAFILLVVLAPPL